MNRAEALYTGEPEAVPVSDAYALCNRLRLTPDEAREWCGDKDGER